MAKATKARAEATAKTQAKASAPSYTVHELAELSGVSARTLHHYDDIGLLVPQRAANGYRLYRPADVDRLQHILLYREAGMALADIARLLDDPAFDARTALSRHLEELRTQQTRLERLIASVEKTLDHLKGETPMSDKEKFEAFKKDLVDENEARYGAEVRERWGDDMADKSNAKMMNMSEEDYQRTLALNEQIAEVVREGVETGADPAGKAGQRAADLHRQWLTLHWPDGTYSKGAHAALALGYLADERFQAYYEQIVPGATEWLVAAVQAYCAQ